MCTLPEFNKDTVADAVPTECWLRLMCLPEGLPTQQFPMGTQEKVQDLRGHSVELPDELPGSAS
eukprot:977662-Prorocentrum_lima.AAC.1